mgnify:CR=1 FL=1
MTVDNEDFRWRRMAEKAERAGGEALGTGWEHRDEIALLHRFWHGCLAGQCVEGRAQRTKDRGRGEIGIIHASCSNDRIVALDHLS